MAKPPSNRIRLTISVSPEAHAVFQRMANATGQSLGMTMGEWLDETSEAAQFLALKLEQARESPKLVIKEMQAALMGAQDEVTGLLRDMRTGNKTTRPPEPVPERGPLAGARPAAAAPSPRLVIRGGKSTTTKPKVLKSGGQK